MLKHFRRTYLFSIIILYRDYSFNSKPKLFEVSFLCCRYADAFLREQIKESMLSYRHLLNSRSVTPCMVIERINCSATICISANHIDILSDRQVSACLSFFWKTQGLLDNFAQTCYPRSRDM